MITRRGWPSGLSQRRGLSRQRRLSGAMGLWHDDVMGRIPSAFIIYNRDPKEGQLFVVINVHKFFDGVLQPIVNMDFDLRGQNPEWRIRLRDRESFSKMIARRCHLCLRVLMLWPCAGRCLKV